MPLRKRRSDDESGLTFDAERAEVRVRFTVRKETPPGSKHLLQILMVNGLDAAPFIKFYPPTAWGSSPNDKSMAVTIFGMARSPPRAHSDAITQRQRMGRIHQCVRFGTHVPGYFRLFPRAEFHRSTSTIRCYRLSLLLSRRSGLY